LDSENADSFIEQLAAYRITCRFLIIRSTCGFVPKINAVFLITSIYTDLVSEFTSPVIVIDFEIKTAVRYFSNIFSGRRESSGIRNRGVSLQKNIGSFINKIICCNE